MRPCIRYCRRDDLRALEWGGAFAEHREIIEEAFARHCAGRNPMLVAELGGLPSGQVWVDLDRFASERAGLLWALRVHPSAQGRGVGRKLVRAAEELLVRIGRREARIAVLKGNDRARQLYERLGYRHLFDGVDRFTYRTPDGRCIDATADLSFLWKPLPWGKAADDQPTRRWQADPVLAAGTRR